MTRALSLSFSLSLFLSIVPSYRCISSYLEVELILLERETEDDTKQELVSIVGGFRYLQANGLSRF